ncbi:MAG TPA: TonB-dependent receptor, partial [Chryseosolibacter sp.]|nr:TonB-dependent receptor [Chryseosolibacter sp.]
YLGFSHRFNENSTVDVTAYASKDEFRFSDQFGFLWNNYLINTRWQSHANRKVSPLLSLSFGRFENTRFEPTGVAASSVENTMNYFHLKETLNYIPTEQHDIKTGIGVIGYLPGDEMKTGFNGNALVTSKRSGKSSGIEWAVFINDEFEWSENISVSAGLRFSHYFHLGPDTTYKYFGDEMVRSRVSDTLHHGAGEIIKAFGGLEPRLSIRVKLRENQSLKAGYNRMIQYIHLISNTTAPTPVDIWQVSTEHTPPQLADNYSIGYFWNLKDNAWETSAEVFYKDMKSLVEYKDFAELLLNDHLETELLSGKGRAWGTELFIRRLKGRWTGWLSYTFSRTEVMVSSPVQSESVNNGEWFPSNYDKPHTVNLVLNKQLGRKGAFSLIFSYNTGRPFTAIESSYITNGTVVPVYSDRNAHRISDYWRTDVSITIGNVLKKVDDSLVFSLYNIFGRENAYSVFYQRPSSRFFIPKPYKLSVLGAAFPSLSYNFRF